MKQLVYTLYAVNKSTFAMTKLKEGTAGQMRKEMNSIRHINSKDSRYSIYQGNNLVSATFN